MRVSGVREQALCQDTGRHQAQLCTYHNYSCASDTSLAYARALQAAALHKLVSHAGPVVACCFYSVGSNTMLATGSTDKSVLLWDACEGTCIGRLDGHEVGGALTSSARAVGDMAEQLVMSATTTIQLLASVFVFP